MPAASSLRRELGDRALDVGLAAFASRVEQLCQLPEALGFERLEGEILELPLDLPDAEPLGQRRVDLHRLAGDALLLLDRQPVERAHVVEPVGELDQDDPDVLGHRQQHLPDVLGLLLLVAVGAELGQLRDAVDELGDLGAEALLDVGQAVLGVLGDVVEECRLDGDGVDAELGQDLGRGDRVRDVRLAGRPLLALVGGDGEIECLADRAEVGAGVLLEDRGVELGAHRHEIGAGRGRGGHGDRRAAGTPLRGGPGRRLGAWCRACHRPKDTLSRSRPGAARPRPPSARPTGPARRAR